MKILHKFNPNNAKNILSKFTASLKSHDISETVLHRTLFNAVYQPDKIIKGFNREFLSGEELG
jgi:hypothetical protein